MPFPIKTAAELSDGAIRPLPRNEGQEEFRGDPTVGLRPELGLEIKKGRSIVPKMARRRGSDASL